MLTCNDCDQPSYRGSVHPSVICLSCVVCKVLAHISTLFLASSPRKPAASGRHVYERNSQNVHLKWLALFPQQGKQLFQRCLSRKRLPRPRSLNPTQPLVTSLISSLRLGSILTVTRGTGQQGLAVRLRGGIRLARLHLLRLVARAPTLNPPASLQDSARLERSWALEGCRPFIDAVGRVPSSCFVSL